MRTVLKVGKFLSQYIQLKVSDSRVPPAKSGPSPNWILKPYMKPSALLVYVSDVQQGLDWYLKVFPDSKSISFDEGMSTALLFDGFLLELVKADEKVGSGKYGTILYWLVPQLDIAIQDFVDVGAKLYRGPMAIEDGLGMCQLEDPFGNLIGLRGPYSG